MSKKRTTKRTTKRTKTAARTAKVQRRCSNCNRKGHNKRTCGR